MALQVLCMLDRQPDLSIEQGLHFYFRYLISGSDADTPEGAASAQTERAQPAPTPSETRIRAAELEDRRFAESLVRGVRNSIDRVDTLLGRCSRNWRLERMSWVDRNLLRLAAFELGEHRDIPARVILNEAIEIARRYSTTESSGFVNGVLDRVTQELGRSELTPTESLPSSHAP